MGNNFLKSIVSYLIIASCFITGNGVAEVGFTFQWYYLIYIPFAIFGIVVYHKINARILILLILIFFYALFTYQYGINLVLKQIINITFSVFIFYNFLLLEEFNFIEIFRKYILFSKIILVIGYIQVLLFSLDFVHIEGSKLFIYIFPFLAESNISFRYQSITQEPSYLVYVFAPVVFICIYNLYYKTSYFINRVWCIFFILAYLLTFSMVGYIGLATMFLFIYFKNFTVRKLSVLSFVIMGVCLIFFAAYKNIQQLKLRIDETYYGYINGIEKDKVYEDVNFTTYAILSNLYVTRKSLSDQPFFGTGLGTYELTYDHYMPSYMKEYLQLNRQDANSMAFRMITETGIVGFLMFCFFLYKHRIKSNLDYSSNQNFFWIINNGILIMVLLFLIRNGNYTMHGRLLFILIYFFTYLSVKNLKTEEVNRNLLL